MRPQIITVGDRKFLDLDKIYFRDEKELPIQPGQKITIFKGVRIHCMRRGWITSKRTHVVTVRYVTPGFCLPMSNKDSHKKLHEAGVNIADFSPDERYNIFVMISPPEATWAGPGGYWQRVDMNLIPEAHP